MIPDKNAFPTPPLYGAIYALLGLAVIQTTEYASRSDIVGAVCVWLNSPGAFSLASDLKSIHAESHNQTNNKFHSRYASFVRRERK